MLLQGSKGAPGPNGASGEPYLRPGQASPPAGPVWPDEAPARGPRPPTPCPRGTAQLRPLGLHGPLIFLLTLGLSLILH